MQQKMNASQSQFTVTVRSILWWMLGSDQHFYASPEVIAQTAVKYCAAMRQRLG